MKVCINNFFAELFKNCINLSNGTLMEIYYNYMDYSYGINKDRICAKY